MTPRCLRQCVISPSGDGKASGNFGGSADAPTLFALMSVTRAPANSTTRSGLPMLYGSPSLRTCLFEFMLPWAPASNVSEPDQAASAYNNFPF